LYSCKKEIAGPTDVRVRNLSQDETFNEVIVNIDGSIHLLGNIGPGDVSEYSRCDIAYSKAEISAKINGETFSTGPVNFASLEDVGKIRITYEVFISNLNNKELKIYSVMLDGPLR